MARKFLRLLCLRLIVTEKRRLIARSFSRACLWVPALFARVTLDVAVLHREPS